MSEDTIDRRQVSVHFDHADFEQGVAQTLASLNKLNTAVENSGNVSGKGFQNLSTQLNSVEQEINHGVLPAMDAMQNKFSFFGTMVDQTVRNWATRIQNVFEKGFGTIFQVSGGMNEYELKMNSIQTILNGTGRSLEDVKKNLEELNAYADQTIYSFKDMTDNIGKFTNNNVPLEKAVAAIKGIANEAALSGATAAQASHAMYNFSQALSTGAVKQIDWKSIENANMATAGFKDALLETAVALGTVTKQGEKYMTTTRNAMGKTSDLFDAVQFRDTLQYNWLTSDVLTQTLELYATDVSKMDEAEKEAYETKLRGLGFTDEQVKKFEELGKSAAKAATEIKTFSQMCDVVVEAIGTGWAETFEIIFGDFEEAKALWTGLYSWIETGINSFTKFRNDMLKAWRDAGGREDALRTFVNILNAIDAVLRPIGEAFVQVFGVIDGKRVADFTELLANMTEKLILTNEQVDNIRNKARMTFTIINELIKILKPFAPAAVGVYSLVKAFTTLNLVLSNPIGLGSFIGMFKTVLWLFAMMEATKPYIPWERMREVVNSINLTPIINNISRFAKIILGTLVVAVNTLWNKFKDTKIFYAFSNFFRRIGETIEYVTKGMYDAETAIEAIQAAFEKLFKDLGNGDDPLSKFMNFFTRSKSAAKDLSATVETITEPVSKSVGLFENLKTRVENVAGSFSMVAYAAEESEKPVWYAAEGLNTMATAAQETTKQVAEVVEETKTVEQPMTKWVEIINFWLDKVGEMVPAFAPVTDNIKGFTSQLENINPIAQNVLDVIGTIISKISWGRVIAVGVIMVYINMLKRVDESVKTVGTSIDKFSMHFDNLINVFGGLNYNLKNLTDTMGGTFMAITSYFNTLEKQLTRDNFKNTAFGILALAAAFAILAAAIYFLDPVTLGVAAGALAVLTGAVIGINAAMAKFSQTVNPSGMAALAAGFVVFAATITLMAASLLGLGVAIAILKYVTGSVNNALLAMAKVLGAFIVIALTGFGAIWLFAGLIASLGEAWQEVLTGAGVLAAMSAAIILFSYALDKLVITMVKIVPIVSGFITAVGALVVGMSVGLLEIVKAVTKLDTIPAIFVSFITAIGTIAVGIVALKVISASMIIIGSNLLIAGTLMGAGALAMGVGIGALAVSLTMIIPALTLVGASIAAFYLGIKLFLKNLINTVTSFKSIGEGLTFFFDTFVTVFLFFGSIIAVIATFAAVIAGMKMLVAGLGKDLMFTSAAIFLMSLALRSWAAIPANQLISGGVALIATMWGLALALRVLNNISIGRIAGAVMALVVALYLLTPLAALYGVGWKVLGLGLLIIAGGLLAIAGSVKLMENVKVGNFLSVILVLTGFIGAMTYLAALMGAEFAENERGMSMAILSIVGMIVTMGIFIAALTTTINNMQNMAQFAGVIVIFGLVVAGLVVALSALANFNPIALVAAAGAISLAMLSFAGAIYIISQATKAIDTDGILGTVLIMATLGAAMYVLSQGMTNLQGLGWKEILAFVGGFAVGIVAIIIALGIFGKALEGAAGGIATAALFIGVAGLAAVGAGFGFRMMAEGVNIILAAVSAFIPAFLQFLSGLADLSERAQEIVTTSGAIISFSKSLVTLAVGMGAVALAGIPMAAALVALALGITAFSLALGVASVALKFFTTSVSEAFETIGPIIDGAVTWGSDLISNFVEGITGGLPDLVDAVVAVATTIWGYLHQSTAEWGPLSTSDQWGGDLIGNIITGMGEKVPGLADTSKLTGAITQSGFLTGADPESTGTSFIDGIKNSILNNQDGLILAAGGLGEKVKDAFSSGFDISGIMGMLNPDYELDKQIAAATDPHVKDRLQAEKELREARRKRLANQKNSTFNLEDLLKKFSGENKEKQKEEGANGENPADAEDAAGKTGKTSASDLKKQREAARIHEKYLKISNDLTNQYVESYGNLMVAMGDTNPTESAAAAIAKLKDNLYEASITADMTEEELTEAAQNAEKQIVESYENIRKKTVELFDGFKEFDSGLTSMSPSKTILKNIEDASYGVSDMENLWRTLSLRKGMDQEYLAELIEGGAEKLGVVRSLVSMNNDEFDKYMSTIANRKELSEHAANVAMTAQAFALQRDEITKAAKTQRAYKSEGKKMIDAWNSAFNSGADNATELCNRIAQDFENLALQNGLTFEQLRDQITSTTATTEEELEKQINAYTNLASTVEQWKSTYMTSYEDVKNGLSGLSTDLSDFDLGDEKSGKHLYNNLAKRNKALGEWGRMLNDLASRGLDKAFLSNLAGQGLSSYQDVKALHSLDTDRLRQMNGMMQSIERQSEAIAKTYGANVANKMVEGVDEGLVDAFKKYAITEKVDWEGLAKEVGVNLELIGNNFSESLAAGMENNIGRVEQAVTTLTDMIINTTQNKIGNVDINARPIVYNDDGSYSTTSTTFQEKWTGDEETGHYRIGHFATIRENGTRLTDEELDAYIEKVLGSDDPFGVDAQMENLLYMVADKISTGEYITDANLQQAFQEASAWDINMHNIQDQMYKDQAKLGQSVVVTPVVNLSAAQNDLKTLGTMASISPLMPPTANPMNQITLPGQSNEDIAAAIRASQYDDTNLVNQVAGLRQDVTTLNDKMGNLQVVMDSGPLVGAIAPKMDVELGTIYRRRNRG